MEQNQKYDVLSKNIFYVVQDFVHVEAPVYEFHLKCRHVHLLTVIC